MKRPSMGLVFSCLACGGGSTVDISEQVIAC